jgi:hypothetical protein
MIEKDYRTSSHEVYKAWIAYKKCYSGAGVPSLVSFVAGYNAALNFKAKRR